MYTLANIEVLVKDFSDARAKVSERVHSYEAELAELKKKHLRGIKLAVGSAADKENALKAAIEVSPTLFESPRTFTMHGVRFGLQKQQGSLEYDDEDKVIVLIKKFFPEKEALLIKPEEKLLKKSLATLSAAELKKLGVEIKGSGDAPFIKSTDSEIDKMVDALLEDAANIPDA
jgi:hypothetical protein